MVEHGPTVYCDLRQSPAELWHATRQTVRRQIRRIQDEGYVAEEDLTWRHYDAFQEVYASTMRRVSATQASVQPLSAWHSGQRSGEGCGTWTKLAGSGPKPAARVSR